uniref:Uncharacterized protein n=1 Tax=Sym plasmid TaxID=28430 RepID=A0A515HJY3_9ZZZZ|nr:hypothetical protein pTT25_00051 [Sym plasmid]
MIDTMLATWALSLLLIGIVTSVFGIRRRNIDSIGNFRIVTIQSVPTHC